VVAKIQDSLGGSKYSCSKSHTLAFQIGGVLFPVDPRDFGTQVSTNSVNLCTPNLVITDPPSNNFLYSWSLGTPFFKS